MDHIDVDKCKITHYPAAVLGRPAEPVGEIDETIRRLVEKMTDIMLANKGMGLAINPTVTPAGDLDEKEEGCLSVPGIWPKIRRYTRATVTATDLDGNEFTEEAEGIYARCLQHESDHLEGRTIVSRMGQAARIANRRQLKKLAREQQGK